MLTGQLYVRGGGLARQLNPSVPQSLNAVVMKALERDPERRYQTAEAMLRDLLDVRDQHIWGQLRIMAGAVHGAPAVVGAASAALLILATFLYRGPGAAPTDAAAFPSPSVETLASSATPSPVPPTPTQLPTSTDTPMPGDAFEPDDRDPAPISLGEVQARTFDPVGDIDRATFRAKAGRSYRIEALNLAVGVDTLLEVLANGHSYTNDDAAPGTLESRVDFTAEEDGMAVITVHNADQYGPERSYELRVTETTPEATTTPTPTITPAGGPTMTPRPTLTPRPTFTPGPSRTNTPAYTRTPTRTYTPTRTPTPTRTRTPTRTNTPTRTPTHTNTPVASPTPTNTPQPTKTATPDRTPLPVKTPGAPTE